MPDASEPVAASLSWSGMQDGSHTERSCNEMTASASSEFPSPSKYSPAYSSGDESKASFGTDLLRYKKPCFLYEWIFLGLFFGDCIRYQA